MTSILIFIMSASLVFVTSQYNNQQHESYSNTPHYQVGRSQGILDVPYRNNPYLQYAAMKSAALAYEMPPTWQNTNQYHQRVNKRQSAHGGGKPHRKHNDRNWHYGPHRPHHNRYRDFANLFNEMNRKAESDSNQPTTATPEANDDDDDDDDFNGRSIVTPGQYPHMAAIGFRSAGQKPTFKCGGSLISDTFVVTAAHCCYFNGQTPHIVKIGDIKLKEREPETDPQRRRVYEIYIHPYYDSSMYYNDIALIELNKPVEFTHYVRPIRLWANNEIPYEKVYTMGYGSTSFAQAPTNILTELDMTIVSWEKCNSTMPQDENAPMGILESQICAKDYEKNRDTCQGDSGGPLQLNLERRRKHKRPRYYLVGITSYGAFCRSQYPGVYTRVSSYVDWIASVVWPQHFENFQ